MLAFLILSILLIAPFASANLQDTLQQKADNIQEKVDKGTDLANTFSDKESREQYLSNKWAELINKTPLGKSITSTTATIKTADPLIELIFGAKFNFNLSFLLIFSIWLILFSTIRKILIPKIVLKIKRFYNSFYHLIIAFLLTSILGATKIIPNLIAKSILFIINKIPSLFTQIFLLLLISFALIWLAIRIRYPHKELRESEEMANIDKKMEDLKGTFNKKAKKDLESQANNTSLIKRATVLEEINKVPLSGRELKIQDIKTGLEVVRRIGEQTRKSDREVEKELKRLPKAKFPKESKKIDEPFTFFQYIKKLFRFRN